ncbi:MAG: class I SAM-dependent methyltransferase [Candidatus Peribacteraceae bacterium]|nr:class I SAM-dependent methyltransferase [Candidatus Peribacteraceae bacterium]MBP9850115.1 class I SAM-dependent methyltransferase [Candidatus Peribacteraceae bacterium]
MQYTFTSDWFSKHIPLWQEKLIGLAGKQNVNALEIGSYEGRSAVWLLDNILTASDSRLTCVDTFEMTDEFRKNFERRKIAIPYDADIEGTFDANIQATGAEKRVTKLKGRSAEILYTLPLDSFDIVYIDGSHTARNVLTDAVLSWNLLKINGIMIFDDVRWNLFPEDILKSPRPAIDAFMYCFDGEFVLMEHSDQVMLRKTKNIRDTVRLLSGPDT